MNQVKNNTATWFKCAAVRALKTLAQTAIATIGTTAVIESVDWQVVVSASLLPGPWEGRAGWPRSPARTRCGSAR